MFEQGVAADASHRDLVRRFRVIVIVSGLNAAMGLLLQANHWAFTSVVVVLTAGLWVTTKGLEGRKIWGRGAAYILSTAYLLTLSLPGIMISIAIMVVLWRAYKSGAFRSFENLPD